MDIKCHNLECIKVTVFLLNFYKVFERMALNCYYRSIIQILDMQQMVTIYSVNKDCYENKISTSGATLHCTVPECSVSTIDFHHVYYIIALFHLHILYFGLSNHLEYFLIKNHFANILQYLNDRMPRSHIAQYSQADHHLDTLF